MFLSVAFVANAQHSLKGKASDSKTGEALVGAHVMLLNTNHKTISDENGNYQFDKIESGTFNLKISFIGYETYNLELAINKTLVHNAKMTTSSILEDAVIISSTRFIGADKSASQTLDQTDIKKTNYGQDLPYILNQTPSMVVTSDAGAGIGYTNLRVRGSDMTRINFTVNGIPINDPESHGVFFVNMGDFASSLSSVQIQRGVGTSSNGAAAFGASINMQTTGLSKEPFAEVNTSIGSFNTMKYNLISSTGLINNKWSFDTRISKLHSDGFVDRAATDLQSVFTSASYYGERSLLRFTFFTGKEKTYQSWYGIPKDSLENNRTYNPYSYKNETDNYQQDHYQLHYSKEFSRYINLNLAAHYTRGKGYYESFKDGRDYLGYYGVAYPVIGTDTTFETDAIHQKWLDNHFYGATFSVNYNNFKKIKATLGGAINQYDGDHYGNVVWAGNGGIDKDYQWYTNNGLKTDMNVYAKAAYQINTKAQVFADVQYRHIDYKMEGLHDDFKDLTGAHTFDFVNPKAGASYEFNRKNLAYLTFAISNREPSRSNFRDSDDGNQPLPEQLMDIELGHTFRGDKWRFNSNVFYMDYKNQLVLTGAINNVGAAIMKNVDESYRVGIEFTSSYRMNKWFMWNANAAFSQNKISKFTEFFDRYDANWDWDGQENMDHSDVDISFSPSVIAGSEMIFTPLKDFDIAVISKYVSKQYIDNTQNDERSIDAYFVNNLRLTYSIKTKMIKRIGFHVQVNNVLNELYETNAWVYHFTQGSDDYNDFGYYPQAGTNFLAGISLRF